MAFGRPGCRGVPRERESRSASTRVPNGARSYAGRVNEELLAYLQPFDRMPPAEARSLLRTHWALKPTDLELLDTERDDSFRVITPQGDFVLKVAHPTDTAELIDMQSAVMEHVAARGLPVQRVVPTLDGSIHVVHGGRVARVISWIRGDLMHGRTPTPTQLAATGVALGGLSRALADFEHPAAHRSIPWDLQSFGELRELPHPPVTHAVFDSFDAIDVTALPQQVIHNDFHPGNVLADEREERYVTGILDFGDAVYSARVIDVALAVAYLIPDDDDPWTAVTPLIDGFDSVVPLTAQERAALPVLVSARLAQRIILPPILDRSSVDPEFIERLSRTIETLRAGT
jgi:hydroxylysine kinase